MAIHFYDRIVIRGRVFDRREVIPIDILTTLIGFDIEMLRVKSRKPNILHPRQIFCYFAYLYTNMSTSEIGMHLLIDHATVLHSMCAIADALETKTPITIYNAAIKIQADIENYLANSAKSEYYLNEAKKLLSYYNVITGEYKTIV